MVKKPTCPASAGLLFCLLVSRQIRAEALTRPDWRIRAGGRLRGPKSEFKLKVSFVQKLLRVSFFGLIAFDMQTNIKSYVAEAGVKFLLVVTVIGAAADAEPAKFTAVVGSRAECAVGAQEFLSGFDLAAIRKQEVSCKPLGQPSGALEVLTRAY